MCHGMGLDDGLLGFERRFEWLETWRQAAETNDNQSQPAMAGIPILIPTMTLTAVIRRKSADETPGDSRR